MYALLIIAISTAYGSGKSLGVESVPGFESARMCNEAAITLAKSNELAKADVRFVLTCVQQRSSV